MSVREFRGGGNEVATDDRVETCNARDTQAIERNIPDQFFPMSLSQVRGDLARNSSMPKHPRDVMRARFGPALKFSQHHQSMIDVLNHARFEAVQANKTKAAHNLFRGKQARKLLLVAKSVLQSENGRRRITRGGSNAETDRWPSFSSQ